MTTRAALGALLNRFAPLALAEPWDNVGFLLDPDPDEEIRGIFLTIDLTAETLDEALAARVNQIISYHPPIFSPLKRLRRSEPREALILKAAEARVGIYSPHTALDAASGGMTDWLAEALGPGSSEPIVPSGPGARTGAGRLVRLDRPLSWDEALPRLKAHLSTEVLRVSRATAGPALIANVAFCPGAGGSVFEKVGLADLFVTGEMRHHDVLARASRGSHVVLTEHTRSERGFLPRFAGWLAEQGSLGPISVSRFDRDPLAYE